MENRRPIPDHLIVRDREGKVLGHVPPGGSLDPRPGGFLEFDGGNKTVGTRPSRQDSGPKMSTTKAAVI